MPGACAIAAQTSRAFGNLGQQFLGEVGAHRRRRGVDDRRRAGDRDRLLQRGDLQLLIDGQRLVDDDANALALDGLEAGELEVDVVDAWRQREEAIGAVGAGDLHLRLNQRGAGCGDGDAGQHGAGVVGHGAVDTAAEILCMRRQSPTPGRGTGRATTTVSASSSGPPTVLKSRPLVWARRPCKPRHANLTQHEQTRCPNGWKVRIACGRRWSPRRDTSPLSGDGGLSASRLRHG